MRIRLDVNPRPSWLAIESQPDNLHYYLDYDRTHSGQAISYLKIVCVYIVWLRYEFRK